MDLEHQLRAHKLDLVEAMVHVDAAFIERAAHGAVRYNSALGDGF